MQIKRNYNEPFFRERLVRRRQRRSYLLRNLLIFLVLLAGAALFILTQPGLVTRTAYAVLGIAATPTPLPSALAMQAQALYFAGDLDEAAELLAQAIAQQPDTIDYLYEYGMLLIDENESEPVGALAERISDIDASDVRGFALRARALVWEGQPAAAIPVARAGLQLDPNFAPLHEALSWAYTATGDWRQGIDYGRLAVELAPGDVRAYWAYANALTTVGAYQESIDVLQQAIDVHPAFLPPYFQLALLYVSADRDQEAISTYDYILSLEPRNAQAQLRLCQVYRKVGEYQQALGECQDAVEIDPGYVAARLQLGLLRYNNREFRSALEQFSACAELAPDNLACNYRMGLSYYYVVREAAQICAGTPDDPLCETDIHLQGCQIAWDTLQDALIQAQAQADTERDVDIIREGLDAITRDPLCAGSSNRLPFTQPTPAPTEPPAPTPTVDPAGAA